MNSLGTRNIGPQAEVTLDRPWTERYHVEDDEEE
jgi:hypothetical protein